jgi:RimJ/RimL family protein N-acetyltransferase
VPDQPLGEKVDWSPVERPGREPLRGEHVTLRPLDAAADAGDLFAASRDPSIWTYLPYGPYASALDMQRDLEEFEVSDDPLFFTIETDRPQGVASYLRIEPEHGAIEIGHIWFGTPLQRTVAATEAIYLLARHVFDDLGYRRLEWKTNALNTGSRRAADRLGFTFEGVFRKQQVVKGRNRDTAWYAIVDDEWPAIRRAFGAWLAPENFDDAGRQLQPLGRFRPPPAGVRPTASGPISGRGGTSGTDQGGPVGGG